VNLTDFTILAANFNKILAPAARSAASSIGPSSSGSVEQDEVLVLDPYSDDHVVADVLGIAVPT
jgi:hypothetical protein